MIKLRLKKYGRKGQPCYRIVAMDSRTKRDGASICLLYTSPSPRDVEESRMPSSA